jgi:hypothetical protein
MKREGPTRRLFALLLDPDVVETQAIGDVREDLAVLGIDPAEAVAIAERLAACARSPAVKLLARLAESDLEVDEEEGRPAPDHRLRQAKPAKVPRPARVPRRWIYGLCAAAASLALVTLLNLIGAFGCSWPWSLLPSSRECYLARDHLQPVAADLHQGRGVLDQADDQRPLRVIPDQPTLAGVWILNSVMAPAALRNSGLQQSYLQELLGKYKPAERRKIVKELADKAKSAARGREIVAIFSVRHTDGTLSDGVLLADRDFNVAEVQTPEARMRGELSRMKLKHDQFVRSFGEKDARVVELQRQIDALERDLELSADTLAALENVAGPLPKYLVAVDLLPR